MSMVSSPPADVVDDLALRPPRWTPTGDGFSFRPSVD